MSYTIGFIVEGESGAEELCKGNFSSEPKNGLLLLGDRATVFETRSKALAAIKRTKKYAKKENLDWGPFYIKRLVRV